MDLLGTRQVDPIHQSPQTRAYGFFAKGTVPSSLIFTHLVSFLFLTIFAGCLPRPTLVADRSVTRLSPRFRCRVGGGALTRWPPSAAQSARADFPHAAFTKTRVSEMQEKGNIGVDLARICPVGSGRQYPRM